MVIASSSSSASSSTFISDSETPQNLKRKSRVSGSGSDAQSVDNESELKKNPKISEAKSAPSRRSDELSSDEDEDEDSSSSDEEEEVQILSHKAQRKLKKKEKTISESASKTENESGPSDPKQKLARREKGKKENSKIDKDSQPRRQNSVWVGNLSFKTTPDTLRVFFDGVGEVTRVNMPTKVGTAKGENRGFAYVDFATPDAKVIAISMSESHLDGRKLLIKDGNDFTGRPAPPVATGVPPTDGGAIAQGQTQQSMAGLSKSAQKILASQKQPPCPCLFVGNLGFEATDEKIQQMIEGHAKAVAKKGKDKNMKFKSKEKGSDYEDTQGDEKMDVDMNEAVGVGIRKVRMGTFEDSGLCKGFAFIDFTSVTHATSALTNPRNHFLDGRKLVLEYASADAARRGGFREGGGKGPGKPGKLKNRDGDGSPRKKRRLDDEKTQEEVGEDENVQGFGDKPFNRPKRDERNAKPRPQRRAKPGAALALAKRESAAIVPSQGTRLTFN